MTVETVDAGCAVVAIHGSLTLGTNLKTVDANVQRLIGSGAARLVIDLSGCPFCDSAGLGFLIHAYGLVGAQGGTMRLCGVGERVMGLFTMTKTDGILPMDADRATSLAKLAG